MGETSGEMSGHLSNELVLNDLWILFDRYRHCLSVSLTNCKCDQNMDNRLLFNDLENQFKNYINCNFAYFANIEKARDIYVEISKSFDIIIARNDGINSFDYNSAVIEVIECDEEVVDVNDEYVDGSDVEIIDSCAEDVYENSALRTDSIVLMTSKEVANECQTNENISEKRDTIDAFLPIEANSSFHYIPKVVHKIDTIDTRGESLDTETAINEHTSGGLALNQNLNNLTQNNNNNNNHYQNSVGDSNGEPFRCDKCDLSFNENNLLAIHTKYWHKSEFICDECDRRFAYFVDFKRHCIKQHSNKKPFKCDKCLKQFFRETLFLKHCVKCDPEVEPNSLNSNSLYDLTTKCDKCEQTFDNSIYYAKHVISCGKKLRANAKLNNNNNNNNAKQITIFTANEINTPNSVPNNVNQTPVSTVRRADEKVLQCKECDQTFVYNVFGMKQYRHHGNQIHGGFYVCDWADCQFRTKVNIKLIYHKRQHKNLNPFACKWSDCNHRSATKRELVEHMKAEHKRTFACAQCDQCFKFKTHLDRHRIRKHSESAFVCEQCAKLCASRVELSKHVSTAHARKRFKCEHCDHVSKSKYSLNSHRRCAHQRQQAFRCDSAQCGRSFFSRELLAAHRLRAHSSGKQFACGWPACKAKFKVKSNLVAHVNTLHARKYKLRSQRSNK